MQRAKGEKNKTECVHFYKLNLTETNKTTTGQITQFLLVVPSKKLLIGPNGNE